MQAGDDDDEALQPHADEDHDRHQEQGRHVLAGSFRPQDLRDDDVAGDQRPVGDRVRAEHAIDQHEPFVTITTVPAHERLKPVSVAHDHAGRQHDLGHVLQVALCDEILQAVEPPQRDRQHQDHREARVDRAGDEVRREDRRVPARYVGDGEVEAHDGVHGDDERRRQAGE